MSFLTKRLAVTTLIFGVVTMSLYYYNLADFEDRRFKDTTVVTSIFPDTTVKASLWSMGGQKRLKEGLIVRGNPYEMWVRVRSQHAIEGVVTLTDVKLVETATGDVIHQADATFVEPFKRYDQTNHWSAIFSTPRFDIPYVPCTLQFQMTVKGPWGSKTATVEVPFEQDFKAYQGIKIWEIIKGISV